MSLSRSTAWPASGSWKAQRCFCLPKG